MAIFFTRSYFLALDFWLKLVQIIQSSWKTGLERCRWTALESSSRSSFFETDSQALGPVMVREECVFCCIICEAIRRINYYFRQIDFFSFTYFESDNIFGSVGERILLKNNSLKVYNPGLGNAFIICFVYPTLWNSIVKLIW